MEQIKIEELKAIIEGEAYTLYDDMMKAKEFIDILAKSAKRIFLIEPSIFKKLVKLHYENSIDNERRKFNEIDELYIEIFGSVQVDEIKQGLFESQEEGIEPALIEDNYEKLMKDDKGAKTK